MMAPLRNVTVTRNDIIMAPLSNIPVTAVASLRNVTLPTVAPLRNIAVTVTTVASLRKSLLQLLQRQPKVGELLSDACTHGLK